LNILPSVLGHVCWLGKSNVQATIRPIQSLG
jgi:hypothetical protein